MKLLLKENFKFSDFQIEKEYINLLNSLIKLDNLNILFIGNSGSGKSTLIHSTIKEYYNTENYPKSNVLNINSEEVSCILACIGKIFSNLLSPNPIINPYPRGGLYRFNIHFDIKTSIISLIYLSFFVVNNV